MRHFIKALCLVLMLGAVQFVYAQSAVVGQDSSRRVISTAVPFLSISPDSRSSGMGDAGLAVSPDANASYWNVSKLAFVKSEWGASVSFTPWLQKLVDDMSISYLSVYKRISKQQTVGLSIRYFNLGSLQFTDINAQPIQDFNPRQISVAAHFAMQLSEKMSIGGTGRFIHSNLSGNITNNNTNTNVSPANTASVDIGMYYKTPLALKSLDADIALGAVISNIGPRITYSNAGQKDYLPMNLRLGAAFEGEFDEYNKLTIALDINKLLVPTPPIRDSNNKIVAGKSDDRNIISAVLGSFGDAPDGFSEELKEFNVAFGLEYWYNDLFALRAGYYNEHAQKGNRKYFTAGLGLRYQAFGLDFAYLIPKAQNNPLTDTIRFTLHFNLNKKED